MSCGEPFVNDQFALFLAQHSPESLASFAPPPDAAAAPLASRPTTPAAASAGVERGLALLRNLRTRLCETHIALDDALPLAVARPTLTVELQRTEPVLEVETATSSWSPSLWRLEPWRSSLASRDAVALAVLFCACAMALSSTLGVLSGVVAVIALAALRRWRHARALRRVVEAQTHASTLARCCAALDRVLVRALRTLQEGELLARGRRPSSALVSVSTQLDDAASRRRSSALLAATASALARIERCLVAAQGRWRTALASADVTDALVTVSTRRVAALRSGAATRAGGNDEYVAFLDALVPPADGAPPVTVFALKQTHQANCAVRSHVLTLLLLASDELANAHAIGDTCRELVDAFEPLVARVEAALDTFELLPSATATDAPSAPAVSTAARLRQRSRRAFRDDLARGTAAMLARLAAVSERLRARDADNSELSDDTAEVSAGDVNAAYARFRRVRDDVRDALHEWERAHDVLVSICSLSGSIDDESGLLLPPRREAVPVAPESDSDERSATPEATLEVEERTFEYDGASADGGESAAPLTREQRIQRMAERQAERERREAALAKERLSSDLMEELAQLLRTTRPVK